MDASPFRIVIVTAAFACVLLLVAILLLPSEITNVRSAAPPASPVLPEEVTSETASGETPYGSVMTGILQSYWIPMLMLVRERYPEARIFEVYRRRTLPLGGRLHSPRDDPDTLLFKLAKAADNAGWDPIDDFQFDSSIYEMRCYRRMGYVFCVLAFTDALRSAPSNRIYLDLSRLDIPPSDKDDFAPVFVITDIGDARQDRQPWIDSSALPIGAREPEGGDVRSPNPL